MIQTLCEPDRAISTPHVPVSAPVLPLRVRDVMSVSPVTILPSLSVRGPPSCNSVRSGISLSGTAAWSGWSAIGTSIWSSPHQPRALPCGRSGTCSTS